MRVPVLVLALLALPLAAGVAQNRGGNSGSKSKVRSSDVASDCKDQQAAALARAEADGHSPYGLDKKCDDPVPPPPPPPPSDQPPTGPHEARGVVFEDIDGNGAQDMFAGEMGLAGWSVQLYWNGQLVGTATTDADGMYLFPNLGNSDKLWSVCVVPQAGYVRTGPAGSACNGDGTAYTLKNTVPTQLRTNFGEMLQ